MPPLLKKHELCKSHLHIRIISLESPSWKGIILGKGTREMDTKIGQFLINLSILNNSFLPLQEAQAPNSESSKAK